MSATSSKCCIGSFAQLIKVSGKLIIVCLSGIHWLKLIEPTLNFGDLILLSQSTYSPVLFPFIILVGG